MMEGADERAEIERLLDNLNGQDWHKFPELQAHVIAPSTQGVYIIQSPEGVVAHVGRTVKAKGGLAQRIRNHLSGKSSFVRKELNGDGKSLGRGYIFKYLVVENDRARALLEHRAISHYCPKHLGIGREEQDK